MASKDELFLATLRSRYMSETEIDNNTANRMVKDAKGCLAKLTLQVVMAEIPAATGAMFNAPQVYAEMVNVIEEVTARFAPGA